MSRAIIDAFTSSTGQQAGGAVRLARVLNTPAGVGGDVWVTIQGFDPGLKFGPCPWTPTPVQGGVRFPHAGDVCLVVFPETGAPWIVEWAAGDGAVDAGGVIAVGGDLSGTTSNAQIVAGAVGTGELSTRSVTREKITLGAYVSALPSGAQVGDVVLYTPAADVVWMMCAGDIVGPKMRWWCVGGAPLTVRTATSTVLTGSLATIGATVTLPAYDGLFTVEYGAQVHMSNASGSNGDIEVHLYRNGGATAVNNANVQVSGLSEKTPAVGVAPKTPGTASGDYLLYAKALGTAVFTTTVPWIVAHCHYLDAAN